MALLPCGGSGSGRRRSPQPVLPHPPRCPGQEQHCLMNGHRQEEAGAGCGGGRKPLLISQTLGRRGLVIHRATVTTTVLFSHKGKEVPKAPTSYPRDREQGKVMASQNSSRSAGIKALVHPFLLGRGLRTWWCTSDRGKLQAKMPPELGNRAWSSHLLRPWFPQFRQDDQNVPPHLLRTKGARVCCCGYLRESRQQVGRHGMSPVPGSSGSTPQSGAQPRARPSVFQSQPRHLPGHT